MNVRCQQVVLVNNSHLLEVTKYSETLWQHNTKHIPN